MISLPVLGFLVIGVLLGCCVGILPGLGGATTIALLIPFVMPMETNQAIALLIGVAAITATTGDLTSILFGIPGEATSAATMVDGHPMALRGEADRAVGAALGSSLAGSLFGGLVLAASIPVAGPLLRSFGSPELFMAAILGVSFVVPVSGASRLKGLIAGGVGLSLATVGLNPHDATPRFTGEYLFLWDGVGLIPTALGLFAIPEIVRLGAEHQRPRVVAALSGARGMMAGFASVVDHWRLVFRCSAIGAGIGLLPGIGASVSQWIAYAHAERISRPKRVFGTGALEGVIGPASANNATLGGALVPTLALGVPGSLSSAMLLSALIVKGLTPGPNMLLPESQGGHLGLVLSLVWLMVIENLVAVGLCLLASRYLVRVANIQGALLVPFILLFTLLGAFAEKNAVGDLFVTAAMGGLGLVMVHLKWPRVPLMLGIMLGSLAESRFFLSMDAYGTAWLSRPGVLGIGFVMALSLLIPRRREEHGVQHRDHRGASASVTESTESRLGVLALLGLSVVMIAGLLSTDDLSLRASMFPRLVMSVTLLLTLAELLRMLWGNPTALLTPLGTPTVFSGGQTRIVAWIGLFVMNIWVFGFVIGAPLAVLLYLALNTGLRSWHAVLLAGGTYVFVDTVMGRVLRIAFPTGSLLEWASWSNPMSWI